MSRKQRIVMSLLSIIVTGFVCTSLSAEEVRKYEIRWGTAEPGGVWPVIGNAMLEDVMKSNRNITGSTMPIGGLANVFGLQSGELNVAFSFSEILADAWEGRELFAKSGKKIQNIRVLASIFPQPTQFVVKADSGIMDVPNLKGKRVTAGPKGGTMHVTTRKILEAYGMSYEDMQVSWVSFREGAELMIDGHIDAILYGAYPYPGPPILNVASQRNIRLLSLSDDAISKVIKKHKGIVPFVLPAGSYKGVDYPVKGIACTVVLAAREDMPDTVAYAIVKAIAENFSRYPTVASALSMGKDTAMPTDTGIPLHEGAEKYYKERGWVK